MEPLGGDHSVSIDAVTRHPTLKNPIMHRNYKERYTSICDQPGSLGVWPLLARIARKANQRQHWNVWSFARGRKRRAFRAFV